MVKKGDFNTYSINSNILVPVSLFCDRKLAVLEILVEYLKETKKLSYHEIAFLINRDQRTIWTAYNRTLKKRKKSSKSPIKQSNIKIPLQVFIDRRLSVFEVVVRFLKEQLKLTYHEIAVLVNRNDRTIWTVYNRAKNKNQNA